MDRLSLSPKQLNPITKQTIKSPTQIYILLQKKAQPSMLAQFTKILKTPKKTPGQMLSKTQDLILQSFQNMFPQSSYNLEFLHKIYEQILGEDGFPGNGQIQITIEEQIMLNYKLVQYFLMIIRQNFVNLDVYRCLEEQTQKAQATIRSHIKIQQEMKMYLEYLESKIQNMNKAIHTGESSQNLKRQLLILQNRQAILQKQKITLIKKNQKLNTELQVLTQYISSSSSQPTSPYNSSFISQQSNQNQNQNQNKIMKSQLICDDSYNPQGWGTVPKNRNLYEVYKDVEKQGFRTVSGSNNQVTQKKRSNYFPGKI